MKRFVTYLYLYDGRIKGNNAGFIKVEINGEKKCISRTDKKISENTPEKEKCTWYMKRKRP
mgnify:CR=1 FL=1